METSKLKDLIGSVLLKDGYELTKFIVEKQHGDMYLRIFVEASDHLITLDEITLISEKLSVILDANPPFEDSYILDVSSSGAEKEIKVENLGNYLETYVEVTLLNAIRGHNKLKGYIKEVENDTLLLEVNYKGRIKRKKSL